LPATRVTTGAVRSYRTFSPLLAPSAVRRKERQRCVFCATFLRVAPTGRYPAHCPAEFGLSSPPVAPRRKGGTIVWSTAAAKIMPPQYPVSRILFPPSPGSRRAPTGDDHSSSPAITGGIKRPTRKPRTGRPMDPVARARASLFGLAPCGVLPATRVTTGAVRSYRTFSPLLAVAPCGAPAERYIFCATFLRVAPTGRYPAHCPAEFGLSSPP
jgi:hypothetical protein